VKWKLRNAPYEGEPVVEWRLEQSGKHIVLVAGLVGSDPWAVAEITPSGMKLHGDILQDLGFAKDERRAIKLRKMARSRWSTARGNVLYRVQGLRQAGRDDCPVRAKG